MSNTVPPRVVVVTRPTEYEGLLLRHGTKEQAKFFLETRGRKIDEVVARHEVQERALHAVTAQVPLSWRRARVNRADLDRFLFEPEDVVVAVGQDGLVANVAKYVRGQIVVGVNPSKQLFDGILVRHPPQAVADLLAMTARGSIKIEERSMVQASSSDGSTLVALNEIYVGHRTHQSSKYTIAFGGQSERHSSSGLIVCTGTGASGWARSVSMRRQNCPALPAPTAPALAFLVREAWPSVATGTAIVDGIVNPGASLVVTSEMNDSGVAFGDGIEEDRLDLPYGQVVTLSRAELALRLAA
jgi:NAD kinase